MDAELSDEAVRAAVGVPVLASADAAVARLRALVEEVA